VLLGKQVNSDNNARKIIWWSLQSATPEFVYCSCPALFMKTF